MSAAAPPLAAELHGVWVYGPGPRRPQDREKPRTPIGALLLHDDHPLLLVWDGPERNTARLSAAGEPLTLEPVVCPTCSRTARIVADCWEG